MPKKAPAQPARALSVGLQRRREPRPSGVGDRCWASSAAGTRCCAAFSGGLPYCAAHQKNGDGALKKVLHPGRPELGYLLVAALDLPKGYRICYWGTRTRCPYVPQDDRTIQYMSGPNRRSANGVVDPTDHSGSQMQFGNCPGVDELATVRTCGGASAYFGEHNDTGLVGVECQTTMAVPAGTQLVYQYGAGWFAIRGLRQLEAGTARYPVPCKPVERTAGAVALRSAAKKRYGHAGRAALPASRSLHNAMVR